MKARCVKCGKEITIIEPYRGLFYAMCNSCCSLDEEKTNYVYSFLGHNKKVAIERMINTGYARRSE